ncbi:hypothetical protein [Arcanobacterium phocae]|uniref:hypothetical protein n=1 Tax=Arcanobacterium phocae TaxID=131112 RepID=UPI001C0F3807|nr:hypothetical protein [Arcanobacterium phocae]
MTTNQQLWGVHNDALFNKLIEEGFILWAGILRRFAFEMQVGDLVFCDCLANI